MVMIALVDCNTFYSSVEAIFRPDLRGKPIIVLSNNDSAIVARNREAKALGVPDLEPYFKIKSQLDRLGVVAFSSNYELYSDISHRVMEILGEYAPEVSIYSIDECFLMLDGCSYDFENYGHEIVDRLWRDVRMPVCVGFGQTKTLAKLANHIAKKSKKLDGVCSLENLKAWDAVFKKLPVSKVWGVGRRLTQRLNEMDIVSIYDLKNANTAKLQKRLNINLERTIEELNGNRCFDFESQPEAKQQIYSTRSFGEKIFTLEELEQAVSMHATLAMEKLRKQSGLARRLTAFISTSRFADQTYSNSGSVQFSVPHNDTGLAIQAAKAVVKRCFKPRYAYARAGVGLIDVVDENPLQLSVFEAPQSEKSKQLMAVLDQLNKHEQQVTYASSGIHQRWAMRRAMKSPSYTTRISDLPVIKC